MPWYQHDSVETVVASTVGPPPPATLSLTTRDSLGGQPKTVFLPSDPVWCYGYLSDLDGAGISGVQVVVGLVDAQGNWIKGLADYTTWDNPFDMGGYETYFTASDIDPTYWDSVSLVATCTYNDVEIWSDSATIKISTGNGDEGFPWLPVVVVGGAVAVTAIALLAQKKNHRNGKVVVV